MTLIEGVGDEVIDFCILVSVLVVGWLAWCSTSIVEQPLIRTVLILQRQTRIRIAGLRANHQSAFERPPNLEISEEETTVQLTPVRHEDGQTNCPESSVTDAESDGPSRPATSEEVLIEAMDSVENDDESSLLASRSAKTGKQEEKKIGETRDTAEDSVDGGEIRTMTADDESDGADISIKLKFINDDQKVVTGSLKEMLGDFKKRHFRVELDGRKLVRLVFKGRILQPDNVTLEKCGLYNNCVVHCLVHQPRSINGTQQNSNTASIAAQQRDDNSSSSSSVYFNPQSIINHHEWDLSRLLVSVVTLALGVAWYSRYHYGQLFTATTTLALYALTAIFTVSLFGNFFPDQDAIRNIE